MAIYYLETSALAKLYVREPGTDRMLGLADRSSSNQLVVLALVQVEIQSALRRRERNGEVQGTVVDHMLASFQRHLETRFLRQSVTQSLLDTACTLVDHHGLTALDAVQLAGYLTLQTTVGSQTPVFVCADRELLDAARREGIPILDPTVQP